MKAMFFPLAFLVFVFDLFALSIIVKHLIWNEILICVFWISLTIFSIIEPLQHTSVLYNILYSILLCIVSLAIHFGIRALIVFRVKQIRKKGTRSKEIQEAKIDRDALGKIGCVAYSICVALSWGILIMHSDILFYPLTHILIVIELFLVEFFVLSIIVRHLIWNEIVVCTFWFLITLFAINWQYSAVLNDILFFVIILAIHLAIQALVVLGINRIIKKTLQLKYD